QGRDREPWASQRQDYDPECLPEIASIYGRRLVKIARNVQEETVHQPDREWLVDRHKRQDQERISVDHIEEAAHDEEWNGQQHVRKEASREQRKGEGRGGALRRAQQPGGGRAAEGHGKKQGPRRDDQAVDQIVNEAAIEPHLAMVLDGRLEKDGWRHRERVRGILDGRQGGPDQRDEVDEGEDKQRDEQQRLVAYARHSACLHQLLP